MVIIRIKFRDGQASGIHRIRNFGEDLWRTFRDNKRVSIDLGEIDRCIDEITFSARGPYVKRAVKEAEMLMREHMVDKEAEIVVEDGTTQA
ncbi:hypothetical protein [Mesorhizobium sp. M7A.F.Ca.US.010.02.1.1]|uniref:hypothetical protein n=1 Tax=unclassified Mesorhizobium TaxID=325217 RepID=UPI000FD5ED5B|nr:hypothetical protein [Mesorhizobium sp. M7A.F.Ca.US.010.02.1.1]RUW93064.1 hypothetical protein EOA19_09310 [Mesorhizobium sp. M7A.F.Ca.US.010.02.1.1]